MVFPWPLKCPRFMSSQGWAVYFSHTLAMLRCGRRAAFEPDLAFRQSRGSWKAGREFETWPRFAGCLNASLKKEGHSRHVLHAVRDLAAWVGARLSRGHKALNLPSFPPREKGLDLLSGHHFLQFLNSLKAHIRGYQTFYSLASSSLYFVC